MKASKSSNKVHHVEPTIRQVSEDVPRENTNVTDHRTSAMRVDPGSTPDLSLPTSANHVSLGNGDGKHLMDVETTFSSALILFKPSRIMPIQSPGDLQAHQTV